MTAPGPSRGGGRASGVGLVPVLGPGRRPSGPLVGEPVDRPVVEADGRQVGEALLAHPAGEGPLARVHAGVDF